MNSLRTLQGKIKRKEARLAVIGLGYVGLPLACEFARAGFDMLGVEIQPDRAKKINSGVSPIQGNEPGLAELLKEVIGQGKLRVTTNYAELKDRDVILSDVETPVDKNNTPQYAALRAALRSLGAVLKQGAGNRRINHRAAHDERCRLAFAGRKQWSRTQSTEETSAKRQA